MQSIRAGRSLRADLVQAGIGREKFEGNIVAVYHEYGAVYIFRGSGQITSADGGGHGVEAPEGAIVVLEEWCTEKLESKMGRRQPPKVTQPAPSPEGRIYAGIDTRFANPAHPVNRFFGASGTVTFPQAVTTDFNVYTTHVVFQAIRPGVAQDWFESAVGQYAWWGGVVNRPNALAWVSTHQTQLVWQMGLTPASDFKRARVSTGHKVSPRQVARMWITDLDSGILYQRHESFTGTRTGVTLVQEQRTLHPIATPWANFTSTNILLSGDSAIWNYVDWTPANGLSGILQFPRMQMHMTNPETYDFNTRGMGP